VTAAVVRVPFNGDEILAIEVDGKPHIIIKPVIESLGLNYEAQRQKLTRQAWATTCVTQVVAADGRLRDMVAVDLRTFLMLMATIPASRVTEDVRPTLVKYQSEVADAIEAYFTKGGAINPRATEVQLDAIISQAEGQARVLKALQGIVHADWLDAQGRLLAGRALGIEPELDPATRPLTVHEYLTGRGLSRAECNEHDISFGGYLSRLYKKVRGAAPTKLDRNVGNAIRPICVYSERDRPLFDEVWEQRFAAKLAVAA
jgi:hypothetical protein